MTAEDHGRWCAHILFSEPQEKGWRSKIYFSGDGQYHPSDTEWAWNYCPECGIKRPKDETPETISAFEGIVRCCRAVSVAAGVSGFDSGECRAEIPALLAAVDAYIVCQRL